MNKKKNDKPNGLSNGHAQLFNMVARTHHRCIISLFVHSILILRATHFWFFFSSRSSMKARSLLLYCDWTFLMPFSTSHWEFNEICAKCCFCWISNEREQLSCEYVFVYVYRNRNGWKVIRQQVIKWTERLYDCYNLRVKKMKNESSITWTLCTLEWQCKHIGE